MKLPQWLRQRAPVKLLVFAGLTGLMVAGQQWLWGQVNAGVSRWHQMQSREMQLALVSDRAEALEQALLDQEILLDQLSIVAPPLSQTPQLIDRLERLADERGVSIRVSSIREGEPVALVPLTIDLRLNGAAPALLSYVDAVEHIQEFAVVPSWSLVSQTVGPVALRKDNFLLQLTLLFYVQAQEGSSDGEA